MDYAGILIQDLDGRMLFQLRDNNPNISHPNRWGLFGGGINFKEEAIDAAIRELKEELDLDVKKDRLKLLIKIPELNKNSYLFTLKINKKKDKLHLKEGAFMDYFTIPQIIRKKNVLFSLRLLLIVYPLLFNLKRVKN